MKNIELNNIDPFDIEDLLFKVEESFRIKFFENELKDIKTFEDFCSHIEKKIQLQNRNDCTTQQAFYKLRNILSEILKIDRNQIYTNLLIKEIFPNKSKNQIVKQLEKEIGFELHLLSTPDWLLTILWLFLFGSIATLFITFKLGAVGIVISFFGFLISNKFASDFELKTIGQIAEKMTSENYLKSRRNPGTFNKTEIQQVLTDLFSNELLLDKSKLHSEASF